MIAHNIYVWRRRGAWENDKNIYDNVINAFPARPAHPEGWQYGKSIADRYWTIMLDRKELAYTTTPTLTDYMNFEKRMR